MTAEATVLLIIALIGCFVGLAGWLSSREKRISKDSEWKGRVDGKLDAILGIENRVHKVEEDMIDMRNSIALIDNKATKAHDRIDKLEGK